MKKFAIGLVAAAGIALSAPAMAQGVFVGAGPVGVGVGVGLAGAGTIAITNPAIAATPMTMVMPLADTAASCVRISTGA